MRLIKIDVILNCDRVVFNRGLVFNARKRPHSNELSLKSDGRNGYSMKLYGEMVNHIIQEDRDGFNSHMRFSVWCREAEVNEWEEKLLKKLHQEIANRMNNLSHLLTALNK